MDFFAALAGINGSIAAILPSRTATSSLGIDIVLRIDDVAVTKDEIVLLGLHRDSAGKTYQSEVTEHTVGHIQELRHPYLLSVKRTHLWARPGNPLHLLLVDFTGESIRTTYK